MYVVCKNARRQGSANPPADEAIEGGVVYEVERSYSQCYRLKSTKGRWYKERFEPVDLDPPHDFEPGDRVRVVAGDEHERALYTSYRDGRLKASAHILVGDEFEADGLDEAGNLNHGGNLVHPAFVERVEEPEPTDHQRVFDLALEYTRRKADLDDIASELAELGVEVQ